MTRPDLVKLIIDSTIAYEKIDLIDRVMTKRILSKGQEKALCEIIGDDVVAVDLTNFSDTYVITSWDGTGKSLQSLGPDLEGRSFATQWCEGVPCKMTSVGYDRIS